ncbi:MAG: N-acetylmuramoyl-L-alanine amidase [Pseudomonadota bacterium]
MIKAILLYSMAVWPKVALVGLMAFTVFASLALVQPPRAIAKDCKSGPLRVAIDVGHSRRDPGAISASGRTEFSFNQRFVNELIERAKDDKRIAWIRINPSGGPIKLRERVRQAAEQNADLFVSIHHDSVNGRYVTWPKKGGPFKGPVSYAFRGFSMFVSRENPEFEQSVRFAEAVAMRFKKAGFVQTLHHGEPIKGENREILRWDLGLYNAPFAVVRAATMPSVLLELGVLVHPDEEKAMDDPGVRQRKADAILAAMVAWCEAKSK